MIFEVLHKRRQKRKIKETEELKWKELQVLQSII